MTNTLYKLVFRGSLVEGFSKQQAQANVARLFNIGAHKADAIFCGKTVILFPKGDFARCEALRLKCLKAGLVCETVPLKTQEPLSSFPSVSTEEKDSSIKAAPATSSTSDTTECNRESLGVDPDKIVSEIMQPYGADKRVYWGKNLFPRIKTRAVEVSSLKRNNI